MVFPQNIARIIETCLKANPCDVDLRYEESMAGHCSFRVGGPADCWIQPSGDGFPAFTSSLLAAARQESAPVFILGGGANILIADEGIEGIVLDTGGWKGNIDSDNYSLKFLSGTNINDAAEIAAEKGLSGLEFFAGMPGTIGGAVYMNARCYGNETSNVLFETDIIDFSENKPVHRNLFINKNDFGYKQSPFQNNSLFILSASFSLTAKDPAQIREKMNSYRIDRETKGHYRFPSAGSVFKNNRNFGMPMGKIIDDLGLKGLRIGGAQVAPWHGNIIINTGGAKAADIRALAGEVAARVKSAAGFLPEPEILFIGRWQTAVH